MDNSVLLILLSLIPVLVFATAVIFLVRWFLNSFNLQMRAFTSHEQKKQMLTLRTQACERLTIFLERINPQSLIVREQQLSMPSQQFHSHLLKIVRTEFEHNLAMQIYLPGEAWLAVLQAKDETIKLVNTCAAQTNPSHPSLKLGQAIIEQSSSVAFAHKKAIALIKDEVAAL